MGFTHYWTFKKVKNKDKARIQKALDKAIDQCTTLIQRYNKAQIKGSMHRLAGFSAHAPKGKYTGLHVNGRADFGHEDFIIRGMYIDNIGFNFCITARKPYDIVVVACLTVLKNYLGEALEVSSDARSEELTPGVTLANQLLNRKTLMSPLD